MSQENNNHDVNEYSLEDSVVAESTAEVEDVSASITGRGEDDQVNDKMMEMDIASSVAASSSSTTNDNEDQIQSASEASTNGSSQDEGNTSNSKDKKATNGDKKRINPFLENDNTQKYTNGIYTMIHREVQDEIKSKKNDKTAIEASVIDAKSQMDNKVDEKYAHEITRLFENNRRWVASITAQHPDYFHEMAKQQSPKYLWIGCSDSRVPANVITGTLPGEIFVHRNIANMVVHSDMNMLSVLSYAVEVLKVRHIIVCGHYGCGGVRAAMTHKQFGLIDNWLRHIKDVYMLHRAELEQIEDEDERSKRLVELNVMEQVHDLCKTSIVQNAWSDKTRGLYVHGWVYDINDGIIHDLHVTFSSNDQMLGVYKFTI